MKIRKFLSALLSVSNLDLKALWHQLSCLEYSSFASHEISPPEL